MPAAKPPFPQLRRGHPLAQGLVLGLPPYEGAGPAAHDLSGAGRDGTLHGGVSWAGGPSGWRLSLDGTSGYVTVPYGAALSPASVRAFACWFNPASIPADAVGHRIVAVADGTASNAWQVVLNPSNNQTGNNSNVEVNVAAGGTISDVSTPNLGLSAGTDYHLAVVWSATPVVTAVYLNGVSQTLTTQATNNVSTQTGAELVLGARNTDHARWFGGSLDGVLAYNRALSAAEVGLLYADSWRMYRRPGWRPAAAAAGAPWGWDDCDTAPARGRRENRFVIPY